MRAISRLRHWNTVQIYDYGYTEDGTFYYVMEYVPGLTLEELVRQHGPVPAPRAIHLLRQVCAALREAHAIQLIHRDVKPANIIVGERGGVPDVVKLLDFGIVRPLGLDSAAETLTTGGRLLGTPAYMSPEQIRGDATVDARSDIYSLGAVGYLLVTGRPPFARDSPILTLAAHLNDELVPPGALQPVPKDLENVLVRCLEKSPQRRYADVGARDEALAACEAAAAWSDADAARWWHTHPASEERRATV